MDGFEDHSLAGYTLIACFLAEFVPTGFFLLTSSARPTSLLLRQWRDWRFGLALTLIHLVDIPITNASVNPARSTSQALFVGDWALDQLWLFWVAPLLGGGLGGVIDRFALAER